MPNTLPTIAVTAGEPAGIGPEICAALKHAALPARIVVIADRALLRERTQMAWPDFGGGCSATAADVSVLHVPLAAQAVAGKLDPANSRYVLRTLGVACDGCIDGMFGAMVTAPVHKGVINDAGVAFTGHTEFLAERTHTPHVVMMLAGGGMRVALATTHLALKDVASHITYESLSQTLRVLHHDLQQHFGIAKPRIAIAGLNPHAGESGHLGREEIDIIVPVIHALRDAGMNLSDPLPADTLFNPGRLKHYDAVLAMYHDQGLPVLKYASFGAGVNVTLGLPIIRTSVDHGTALDIAGSGKADAGSLIEAVRLAIELARVRNAR
ncbi:MAG: 4-hydroxythreonine-4-phosphate dehydrogenase PdxA [Burkholderiales bacterium]